MAQMVKHLPVMQETRVQSLAWEDSLEKEMVFLRLTMNQKRLKKEQVFQRNTVSQYFKGYFLLGW